MTELEKIEYTRGFIDKLANGINPLTDQPVPESDLINNVRISRCLFYVSDLLRQMAESGSAAPRKTGRSRIPAFTLTLDERAAFPYSDIPLSISEIARRINELGDPEKEMKKLPYTAIMQWLLSAGVLEENLELNGRRSKRPTRMGEELGISTEMRQTAHGEYLIVVYSREAQQFILDNLDAILELSQAGRES